MSKYGIWAVRSSNSQFGAKETWLKKGGKPMEFATDGEASEEASKISEMSTSPNVSYEARAFALEG